MGRTLRLGQTRQVHVTYFLMASSVEEELYAALERARSSHATRGAENAAAAAASSSSLSSSSSSSSQSPAAALGIALPPQTLSAAEPERSSATIEVIDVEAAVAAAAAAPWGSGTWGCGACTFTNEPGRSKCEICRAVRPLM